MNNETTPEYSLPEGTIEEISKSIERVFNLGIDAAIEKVLQMRSRADLMDDRASVNTLNQLEYELQELKKLKKP